MHWCHWYLSLLRHGIAMVTLCIYFKAERIIWRKHFIWCIDLLSHLFYLPCPFRQKSLWLYPDPRRVNSKMLIDSTRAWISPWGFQLSSSMEPWYLQSKTDQLFKQGYKGWTNSFVSTKEVMLALGSGSILQCAIRCECIPQALPQASFW